MLDVAVGTGVAVKGTIVCVTVNDGVNVGCGCETGELEHPDIAIITSKKKIQIRLIFIVPLLRSP